MNTPVNRDVFDSSANTPKTGARILDDYGDLLVVPSPPVTVKPYETGTAVYLPGPNLGLCREEVARNILWRTSVPGTKETALAVQEDLVFCPLRVFQRGQWEISIKQSQTLCMTGNLETRAYLGSVNK